MPELTISEEQQSFLDSLRAEIQEEVRYGHVRPKDALQYLIDQHDDGDLDFDVDAPTASPAQTEEVDWAEDGSAEEAAAAAVEAADSDTDEPTNTGDPVSVSTTADTDDGSDDSDDDGDSGEDRLNAMMNLMDTHDEKWREASKEDARYEVDMPDGTTEYVQTKDDVRAHLFKNY
ncbi:hypothetical protein [Haloarchaeobius sp. DFWS5]|uniref:hypothetical protein n=1 Tax=Haloarchaeobius sp. DFWS5 TaxID=3446114 RepID=UPI003EB94B9D